MKTAAAILQELAVKLGVAPEYECIAQTGPQHQSTFEYSCSLCGESAKGIARSKKEAKQEAATKLLSQLARAGHSVPPPWGFGAVPKPEPEAGPDPLSYVALLKEFCEEYKLPTPEYNLVGDAGPPHLRSFTISASVGSNSRQATALNKKSARQSAAEAVYKYLRSSLPTTQDFVEIDALARALDKKMERFKEERNELPWRPPLNQIVSEYQCGLLEQFEEKKRVAAMDALQETTRAGQPPSVQLECAASALGLELHWGIMPSNTDEPLVTVELLSTSPSLLRIGKTKDDVAQLMINYIRMTLIKPPRDPIIEFREKKASEHAKSQSNS